MDTVAEKKRLTNSDFELWFSGLIHKIKTDKLMLQEGVASEDMQEFYETLMRGSDMEIHQLTREKSTKFFVRALLEFYFNELNNQEPSISKLALSFHDTKMAVWVVIPEDDFNSEKKLYLVQAKANSVFRDIGFTVDTFVLEENDDAETPEQYIEVIDNSN